MEENMETYQMEEFNCCIIWTNKQKNRTKHMSVDVYIHKYIYLKKKKIRSIKYTQQENGKLNTQKYTYQVFYQCKSI